MSDNQEVLEVIAALKATLIGRLDGIERQISEIKLAPAPKNSMPEKAKAGLSGRGLLRPEHEVKESTFIGCRVGGKRAAEAAEIGKAWTCAVSGEVIGGKDKYVILSHPNWTRGERDTAFVLLEVFTAIGHPKMTEILAQIKADDDAWKAQRGDAPTHVSYSAPAKPAQDDLPF